MFCVDLSKSMVAQCDFSDTEESEDDEVSVSCSSPASTANDFDPLTEDMGSEMLALDELKGTSHVIPIRSSVADYC